MKRRRETKEEAITLQMTPMIDIVFQLLVFFVFTFKIVLPEGDFNIRMPSSAAAESSDPNETPLILVKLNATHSGELASVQMNDKQYAGKDPFFQLHTDIRGLVNDAGGPGSTEQEVEIEADYDLKYRYAVNAMTAITGQIDPETGEQHRLIERVRFAPLADQ